MGLYNSLLLLKEIIIFIKKKKKTLCSLVECCHACVVGF